jgi:hypothetical protein
MSDTKPPPIFDAIVDVVLAYAQRTVCPFGVPRGRMVYLTRRNRSNRDWAEILTCPLNDRDPFPKGAKYIIPQMWVVGQFDILPDFRARIITATRPTS